MRKYTSEIFRVTIIVDYGLGNIGSIQNMIKKVGYDSKVSSNPSEILDASKIILPGVGAFDTGMSNLNSSGLTGVIKQKAESGAVILGICLGMQLLADSSEEGCLPGLGLIKGHVKKFHFGDNANKLKIPHMGWNIVNPKKNIPLFADMPEEMRFYFVHSYHYVCDKDENVAGATMYGYEFASAISSKNIYGMQFHPEKSHKFGMQLFRNFMELEC